jgi:hypothetical protein
MNPSNKQIALKPQDLLVLLKMSCHRERTFTYAQLSAELGLSASEAHASLRRATHARLIIRSEEGGVVIQRAALLDFVLHGARYCFPASIGPVTRGMPTGYAAPPLRDVIVQPNDLPPVWPQSNGAERGIALYPLYSTVPAAAAQDHGLYEHLALFDALRFGAAREREMATQLLTERL